MWAIFEIAWNLLSVRSTVVRTRGCFEAPGWWMEQRGDGGHIYLCALCQGDSVNSAPTSLTTLALLLIHTRASRNPTWAISEAVGAKVVGEGSMSPKCVIEYRTNVYRILGVYRRPTPSLAAPPTLFPIENLDPPSLKWRRWKMLCPQPPWGWYSWHDIIGSQSDAALPTGSHQMSRVADILFRGF